MKFIKIFLITNLFCAFTIYAQNDSLNNLKIMKINSGLNNILRTYQLLIEEHLSDIDPELLADEAIRGMTNSLDDFTEYLHTFDKEIFNRLLKSNYIGIGINTYTDENSIFIEKVLDESPAERVGIKVGDKLFKIDGERIDNLSDLNTLIQEDINSKLKISIIRGYKKLDTIDFIIERSYIPQNGISYYSLINDSIVYIKLANFSNSTKNEIKNAYLDLAKQSNFPLKGIILDLRDNGGGLMKSAFDVFELFVPIGKYFGKMVNKYEESIEFYTKNQPLDTNISIAVIINQNTASASEYLTVALQDYQRAKVIGSISAGKGISQILRDISYLKSLKITSEKYISPNGNDINRINYFAKFDNNLFSDSTIFTNQAGKIEKYLKGIIPDIYVKEIELSPLIYELKKRNIFRNFANDYIYYNIDKIPTENDNNLYREFRYFSIDSFRKLNVIDNIKLSEFKKNYNNSLVSAKLDELSDIINNYFINSFDNDKNEIVKYLNYEIMLRHKSFRDVEEYILKEDTYLMSALKYFGINAKSFYFNKKAKI